MTVERPTAQGRLLRPLYATALAAFVFWTVVVGASLWWTWTESAENVQALAVKEARANFAKDLAFRRWATRHGGVYVPPGERTPPSPYLSHIPNRDVVTRDGRQLTLMNPAYMLRQLMTEFSEQYGVKGRITSLRPLNPANAPDAWERAALEAFEDGVEEVQENTEIAGEPYLRLMRPLVVEPGCLKCHAHQGYVAGDVRGGVGVSVPLAEYLAVAREEQATHATTHGIIWLIGLLGLGVATSLGRKRMVERQEAETALAESEETLRTIFDQAAVGVALIETGTGRFVRVNQRYADLVGYTVDEMTSRTFQQITHPDDLREDLDNMARLVAGEIREFSMEKRYIRSDGTLVWVALTVSPTWQPGGDPVHHVAIVEDIGARKDAETALKRTVDELARSNVELERFAFVASHDLQEPVRSVVTYAQLLAKRYEGKLDGDADAAIGFIVSGAKRMRALVSDVLAYSRAAAPGGAFAPVDMGLVAADAVDNLDTLIREAGATVSFGTLPRVNGDVVQLTELVQNLIANAVKFRNPARAPAVRVEAAREGTEWVFRVTDNGIGIEPQYLEQIFAIFKRLHPMDAYPGTGVGLALCSRIAEHHGGRIWAESVPGRGSTFLFALPVEGP